MYRYPAWVETLFSAEKIKRFILSETCGFNASCLKKPIQKGQRRVDSSCLLVQQLHPHTNRMSETMSLFFLASHPLMQEGIIAPYTGEAQLDKYCAKTVHIAEEHVRPGLNVYMS